MNHGFTVDTGTLPKSVKRRTSRCSTAAIADCGLEGADVFTCSITRSVTRADGQPLSVRQIRGRG